MEQVQEEGWVQEATVIGLQELGVGQQLGSGLEQLLGLGAGLEQVLVLGPGLGTLLGQVQ